MEEPEGLTTKLASGTRLAEIGARTRQYGWEPTLRSLNVDKNQYYENYPITCQQYRLSDPNLGL